jgi:hypothetical protein
MTPLMTCAHCANGRMIVFNKRVAFVQLASESLCILIQHSCSAVARGGHGNTKPLSRLAGLDRDVCFFLIVTIHHVW